MSVGGDGSKMDVYNNTLLGYFPVSTSASTSLTFALYACAIKCSAGRQYDKQFDNDNAPR